jgi:hypothetical protein
MIRTALAGAVAIAALVLSRAVADDGALSLADLPEYARALRGQSEHEGPAVSASFRDLWDHPDRYRGQRVQVEGRVARRFRQAAVGDFPPLEEVWITSPAGDPLCLVFPAPAGRPPMTSGVPVRFVGTFLRRVEYPGGDAPRLAPLIVGDKPPAIVGTPAPAPSRPHRESWIDWGAGLAVAALVALVLWRQHARKPSRRAAPEVGPDPDFVPTHPEENGRDPGGLPGQP